MIRLLINIQHQKDALLISIGQFSRLVRKLTQFNIEIYTNLSFIEQDIWHDVRQTPCDNEDHILVCIGQLTNLEKDTKTKSKTDHLHSLPCTKLYNLLIMALTSVNETLLIQVQISKVVTLFVCFFVFFFISSLSL